MFEGKLFFEVFNKTVIKARIKNKKNIVGQEQSSTM